MWKSLDLFGTCLMIEKWENERKDYITEREIVEERMYLWQVTNREAPWREYIILIRCNKISEFLYSFLAVTPLKIIPFNSLTS